MNSKIKINSLLNLPESHSQRFHEKTKLKTLGKNNLSPKKWSKEWKIVYYKAYGRLTEISLPKPDLSAKMTLAKTLYNRASSRIFDKSKLSLNSLSALLYFSAGLRINKPPWSVNRFYPSAGARYPLETYLISLNSALPRGLYHYYLKNHSLEVLLKFDEFDYKKYFNQKWIARAGCLIIITAVFKRNTIKYGDRGYRHILIETGHLGQNIYLLSAALGLSCCAIGGYVDDNLNKLLDIDGINEAVVYVLAVGTI